MNTWKTTAPLNCLVTSEILCYQGFKSMKTRYNFGFSSLTCLFACLLLFFLTTWQQFAETTTHTKLDLEERNIECRIEISFVIPLNQLLVLITLLFFFVRNLADSSINSWPPFSRTHSLDSKIGSMPFRGLIFFFFLL